MKVEDVPAEWMAVAERDLPPGLPLNTAMLRAALAAVAPLIAAAEREACAKVALSYPNAPDAGPHEAHGRDMAAVGIAAAIRARSDAP